MNLQKQRIDDRTIKLTVSFSGKNVPKEKDVFQGTISLKTNSRKEPEMKSRIFVRMLKPVRVTPGSVYFFASPKGKTREATVELSPTQADNIQILGVSSDIDFIKAEPLQGGKSRLKIILSNEAQNGKFSGFITVKTDLEEQPEVRIPVRGSVI